jgi:serine/threonine protein kinase/type II secretory pathway predicted ATPase ExeA
MRELLDRSVLDPPHPSAIGPFRITGILGQGGMGIVFRGEHRDTGAPVAVKTLRDPRGSPIESLRREIHALRRLDHPGIVRIVDDGTSGGTPWYAMDLLVGSTLRDRIRNWEAPVRTREPASPTTPATLTAAAPRGEDPSGSPTSGVRRGISSIATRDELLSILRLLCAPLSHLHYNGIVHRDLKPENIFITTDGAPVLVDLGISSLFGGRRGREELDVAGAALMGTVAYMAPEQIRGERVDARADLYALGCIFYECLTGDPPFALMAPSATLRAHLSSDPVPPSHLVDGVPGELDRLVMQLLRKDVRDRTSYADDVGRVLADVTGVDRLEAKAQSPAYLYSPLFVGREAALNELQESVRQLQLNRKGGILWLGGESGVGKTRLAMEAVADATRRDAAVVVSDCTPVAIGAEAVSASSPLRAFGPLLLAVADRCRECGPTETRRLLAEQGKILLPYQPALADVPGIDDLPDPPKGDEKEARAAVIAAVLGVTLAFADARPVLLVVDDVQWADDLSLDVLQRLSAMDLREASVLVVGTCRMDQAPARVRALVTAAGARRIELARLGPDEAGAMIQGMLGHTGERLADLLKLIGDSTNGNPFFIVEYLRAAVEKSLLTRDGDGAWVVGRDDVPLGGMALPDTISELIEARLRNIGDAGDNLLRAASVLGREFRSDTLFLCAGAPP